MIFDILPDLKYCKLVQKYIYSIEIKNKIKIQSPRLSGWRYSMHTEITQFVKDSLLEI